MPNNPLPAPGTSQPDPRVTVVVITHNRRAELARTLDHLADLPEQPAVIVVDNGSDDGSAAYVRWRRPGVLLIAARRNLGAVGRNVGLRRVMTPYAAFCDDDTWWEPGSLALAADALDAHPDIAAVTARIVVEPSGEDDPIWFTWLRRPVRPALRRTAELAGTVPRDAVSAAAFWAALRGLPWVLRERRPVPPEVEAQIQLLEEPRRASSARRYVG